MNITLVVILSLFLFAGKIYKESGYLFLYQLFQGIGEVITDFGMNGNHGVNGFTAEVQNDHNCIFTNRGGYFGGSNLITPPANSVIQNSFTVPTIFTMQFWILIKSGGDGMIFSRYDSSNNLLIAIYVSSNQIYLWAYTDDQAYPSPGTNGANYFISYDEWNLVSATVREESWVPDTAEIIYVQSNTNTVTFTGTYNNDAISSGTNIGCDPSCTAGFKGYIYYITFADAEIYPVQIASVWSSSCSGCNYCGAWSTPCYSTCANPQYPDNCSAQCNCANNAVASCYDADLNTCIMCDSSCSRTCSGLTSADCVDIKATYCGTHPYSPIHKSCLWNVVCPSNCYYCEINTICITCDPGYYVDNAGQCSQCDSSCTTCSGSATHCLSCSVGGYTPALSNGACQCTSSQYQIASSPLTCGDCDSSCSSCAGSGISNCNTCADSTIIPASTPGSCSCPSNKYIATKNTLSCGNCHSSCGTCSGPTSNDCLTCPNFAIHLSPSPNSCTCNSNEYMSSFNPKTCSPCHSSCSTCSGGFITDCLSCSNSVVLSSHPGQCVCTSNQYISQSSPLICTSCDSTCSTCSGPLPTDCKTCSDTSITPSTDPGSCFCDTYTYIISKSPLVCGDCDQDCATCNGWSKNNCLSCKNNTITPSSDGYCKCQDNEYIISATILKCGACDSTCSSCVGPGPDQCLTCKNSSMIMQSPPSSCTLVSDSNSNGNDLKNLARTSGTFVGACLIAAGFFRSIIEGKTVTLWTYVNIVQLLAFIPLQNIAISENLYEFWKAFLSYTRVPSIGKLFYGNNEVDDAEPYSNWEKYGYKGSSFLVNGGAMFLIAIIVVLLWATVYFLSFSKKQKVQKIAGKLMSKFNYNAFIRLWLEIYILLMAANIVGINNLLIGSYSAYVDSILSVFILILSVFLNILFLVILYVHKSKIFKNSKKITAKYGSLFEEFRCNKSYIGLLYYPFFLLRRFILVINLYNASRIPLLQWIINLLHSAFAVLFLYKYWRFKEKDDHKINLWGEMLVAASFLLTGPYIYGISSNLSSAIQIIAFGITFIYLVATWYFLLTKIYATIKTKLTKKTKIITAPEAIGINASEINDFQIKTPSPNDELLNSNSNSKNTAFNSNETLLSHRDELKINDLDQAILNN